MIAVKSHTWLAFTQMQGFDPGARTFAQAHGSYLTDARGHRVFDAVSSIWTIVHGHCHPKIVEAIARQAARLDHATMLGATNPVAEALAERLCALTGFDRAFFASDGASAIEAALKMALQYWQNRGDRARTRFVRLSGAYHGDTAGAMSVSDIAAFKSRFAGITFETRAYGDRSALHGDDVAAVIVEPLVQAAAGMQLVDHTLYDGLRERGTLLIVDEIATGFGRTGEMFASAALNLRPDMTCVGKSLTGGALALSAVLASERVFEAFLGSYEDGVHFYHGHSFSGNPIACAAALASLDLFDEEATLERVAEIASRTHRRLSALARSPYVEQTRQAGAMAGIELHQASLDARGFITPAWRIANGLYERGHFTRPIGSVVQFVPPFCATDEEIDAFFDAFEEELA